MRSHQCSWHPGSGWSGSLPDADANVVFVFAAARLDAAPLFRELASHCPAAVIAGCSTSGEIHGAEVQDVSASVLSLSFDEAHAHAVRLPATGDDLAVGRALGEALKAPDLRAVVVLSDGLAVNGSHLARALTEVVGPAVHIGGGLGGDGDRFESTWTRLGTDGEGAAVIAVGLYGSSLRVRGGSRGGWTRFGPVRRVTQAVGNVLYCLDDQPALDLYRRYLGDLAAGLPATGLLFPLAVLSPDGSYVVRTILGTDDGERSITFAGDVPEGSRVQLMRAVHEHLLDGAAQAGVEAMHDLRDDLPTAAIAVSCVGRRMVLGDDADEELEALHHACPPHTTLAGFYSYGELGPHGDGRCVLHNQTMTVTLVQEEL